jgi:hypothetical protein
MCTLDPPAGETQERLLGLVLQPPAIHRSNSDQRLLGATGREHCCALISTPILEQQ